MNDWRTTWMKNDWTNEWIEWSEYWMKWMSEWASEWMEWSEWSKWVRWMKWVRDCKNNERTRVNERKFIPATSRVYIFALAQDIALQPEHSANIRVLHDRGKHWARFLTALQLLILARPEEPFRVHHGLSRSEWNLGDNYPTRASAVCMLCAFCEGHCWEAERTCQLVSVRLVWPGRADVA